MKFYNMKGEQISANIAEKECLEFEKNRVVAKEYVGEILVSTVLLGIDYSYNSGPPIIFETCVFGGELDSYLERYHTKEKALEGHKAIVERVKASIKDAAS